MANYGIWKEKNPATGQKESVHRLCHYCGKRFLASHKNHLFHTRKCRLAANPPAPAKALDSRTCEHCGKPFSTNQPHAGFCSLNCRVAAFRAAKAKIAA